MGKLKELLNPAYREKKNAERVTALKKKRVSKVETWFTETYHSLKTKNLAKRWEYKRAANKIKKEIQKIDKDIVKLDGSLATLEKPWEKKWVWDKGKIVYEPSKK